MTIDTDSDSLPLTNDPDGVVRVASTRVTLDTVVAAFQDGATAEAIVQQYPSLQLADVYSVIGFYLRRSGDVEEYLARRDRAADTIREENEARLAPAGIRDRLLARQKST